MYMSTKDIDLLCRNAFWNENVFKATHTDWTREIGGRKRFDEEIRPTDGWSPLTFCSCLFCTPAVGVRGSAVPAADPLLAPPREPAFAPAPIPLVPAFAFPIPDAAPTPDPDPLAPAVAPLVVKPLEPLVPAAPLPLVDVVGLFAGLSVVLRQSTLFSNLYRTISSDRVPRLAHFYRSRPRCVIVIVLSLPWFTFRSRSSFIIRQKSRVIPISFHVHLLTRTKTKAHTVSTTYFGVAKAVAIRLCVVKSDHHDTTNYGERRLIVRGSMFYLSI